MRVGALLLVAAAVVVALAWPHADHLPAREWPGVAFLPVCDGFDFPVGPPDAQGYYDAQPFGQNRHLGSDWNGNGGMNTDLGDPVFAIAAGVVVEVKDHGGGWGNVVRIVHACGVESLYAHFDRVETVPGAWVRRGQRIGTIGTAGGRYLAHLHLEIRDRPLPLGGGYSEVTLGYVDPTAYIRARRPATSSR